MNQNLPWGLDILSPILQFEFKNKAAMIITNLFIFSFLIRVLILIISKFSFMIKIIMLGDLYRLGIFPRRTLLDL